ncbi:MAG TPA: sigma-54 dependent transcriptional regulator [Candidatus Acidoferrales bacterium]|jgi:DNA-binding NtrC family response regulator|nr:sigma-54 dependent transcriptional regulator [Candidatus Acidoferrales bacterium]
MKMSSGKSNSRFRILIVDDDDSTRSFLSSVLTAEGYQCLAANNIGAAEALLRQEPVQLAFLDLYLGTANGLNVLDLIKVLQPHCACVMMTAHMSVETVAKSMTSGAVEYLAKPLLIDDLLAVVRKVQATQKPAEESASSEDEGPETSIIGRTPKMLEVYRAVARVAPTDVSVLILGASGTGKELVARAIHDHSSRAKMPFVPVNCGALPENILESELFGHEKGAFTGADSSRPGLFEAAHGGTLFLDEISETKPSFQVNLLRAVQEQQIRRVGSHKYTPVNVRILAASNRDLTKMMAAGQFREDLYYRLSVVEIKLPGLEERREDIPLLVQHFLKRSNHKNKRSVKITDEAVRVLSAATWPGNVRELENLVERLAIFCTSGEIGASDVEHERRAAHSNGTTPAVELNAARTLEDMERQHILRVLQENAGNKSKAARALGIERKTLYQKARRLGIDLQVEPMKQ